MATHQAGAARGQKLRLRTPYERSRTSNTANKSVGLFDTLSRSVHWLLGSQESRDTPASNDSVAQAASTAPRSEISQNSGLETSPYVPPYSLQRDSIAGSPQASTDADEEADELLRRYYESFVAQSRRKVTKDSNSSVLSEERFFGKPDPVESQGPKRPWMGPLPPQKRAKVAATKDLERKIPERSGRIELVQRPLVELKDIPEERKTRPGYFSANFELSDEEESTFEIQNQPPARRPATESESVRVARTDALRKTVRFEDEDKISFQPPSTSSISANESKFVFDKIEALSPQNKPLGFGSRQDSDISKPVKSPTKTLSPVSKAPSSGELFQGNFAKSEKPVDLVETKAADAAPGNQLSELEKTPQLFNFGQPAELGHHNGAKPSNLNSQLVGTNRENSKSLASGATPNGEQFKAFKFGGFGDQDDAKSAALSGNSTTNNKPFSGHDVLVEPKKLDLGSRLSASKSDTPSGPKEALFSSQGTSLAEPVAKQATFAFSDPKPAENTASSPDTSTKQPAFSFQTQHSSEVKKPEFALNPGTQPLKFSFGSLPINSSNPAETSTAPDAVAAEGPPKFNFGAFVPPKAEASATQTSNFVAATPADPSSSRLEPGPASGGFSFGNSLEKPAGGFSFSKNANSASLASTIAETPSFSQQAKDSGVPLAKPAPAFNFGPSSNSVTKETTPAFGQSSGFLPNTAAKSSTPTNQESGAATFGAAAPASGFAFGQSSTTQGFGGFAQAPNQPNAQPQMGSSGETPTSFAFGTSKASTPFGDSRQGSEPPNMNFESGARAASNFNFGAPANSGFVFGSNAAGAPVGSNPAGSTSSSFAFGQNSNTAPAFGAGSGSANTPANPGFGGQPNPLASGLTSSRPNGRVIAQPKRRTARR